MQFDSGTIYKILLVILFIIIFFQILNFFSPPKVIAVGTIGNGGAQTEAMKSVQGDWDATFYVKDEENKLTPYQVENVDKELVASVMPSQKYARGMMNNSPSWGVDYERGNVGDNIWNIVEPKMVLTNNSLNCVKPNNIINQGIYQGPVGVPDKMNESYATI